MLTGSIPEELIKKVEDGSLSLSVNKNPNLCSSASCKKKTSLIIPLAVSIATLFVLTTALAIFLCLKRIKNGRKLDGRINNRKNISLESKNLKFTYNEIIKITDNFKTVLGEGGFGKVYFGYLDDKQVAVKVLSLDSRQGYEQFETEVKILLRVHHKNLTDLVGYCYDDTNMGIIYEYVANGDLKEHLSGKKGNILSWEERIQIATQAAQGLEYLHHGCKPPMVHRDVKSTNILSDSKFHAKLADFGLSKAFPTESGTHVFTVVAGTPGYLDPELTEKGDVYSFGAVMLEIITSRPVLAKAVGDGNNHLSNWVKSMLENGDIQNTVDPRLNGDFDTNSAWKAVEVALACLCPTTSGSPAMNQVVLELNECLEMERTRKYGHSKSENSSDMANVNLKFEFAPLAR